MNIPRSTPVRSVLYQYPKIHMSVFSISTAGAWRVLTVSGASSHSESSSWFSGEVCRGLRKTTRKGNFKQGEEVRSPTCEPRQLADLWPFPGSRIKQFSGAAGLWLAVWRWTIWESLGF